MYKVSSSNYRDNILNYFKSKDRSVYKILNDNLSDWNYPFKTAYRLDHDSSDEIDVAAFLLASSILGKNRIPIREKASLNEPERSDRFINKLIEENNLSNKISAFVTSVYIADKLLSKLIYDSNFNWFMKQTTMIRNEEYDAEYIIVDVANVYSKIKEYTGNNRSIIYLRDKIIGTKNIFNCVVDIAKDFSSNMNGNLYKYIFVNPSPKKGFEDDYFLLSADCREYIGERCPSPPYTNEVDDCFVLMLYDYCQKKFDRKVSILSADNYDFWFISQDFFKPLRRALISNDKQAVILSHDDIEFEHPRVNFDFNTKLTIFEEDLLENE